ncbi:hypothetical protein TCAL_00807 [Tigriopus californicus]|uniref:NADH dehydrogenase [ubiquinone] 1 beta subcomplex subunit 8, mitochondrial n=1 Tax=Tigriopus californicus TaxID=6832 RepID=A0A553NFE5_TIGCA|nr:NADH dehydrogenase [ubiquinone] 1 beta subcomplex subunit 8, mitochondrial-like [Tigriopus californicus]TRY64172.1 hypothetical protein TCAL_00807 [Tigriopus californicus]|eukprot:TCALIF_00806-PA protein Name:"Similar to NDUFB8 NADH dehydrogenase [ubiquinone] 1 beta subcomplex subunit 8, mitochondrial (Bos taurus)" AED:0.03 eAED:0.03 QI:97/1/1/1/1/1/2/79/191
MSTWSLLAKQTGKNMMGLRTGMWALRARSGGIMVTSVRTAADRPDPWNYLWQPGPYPRTQEEREAAAKKYGLIVEDYKPYPDDGRGLGDYPNLPVRCMDSKPGQYNWDIPEEKRNFGEPLHMNFHLMLASRPSLSVRPRYTQFQYLRWFLGLISFFTLFQLIAGEYEWFHPFSERQTPGPYKKKFYSFELE